MSHTNPKHSCVRQCSAAFLFCSFLLAAISDRSGVHGAMQAAAAIFSAKPLNSSLVAIPSLRSQHRPIAAELSTSVAERAMAPKWTQKTVVLPPQRRGCHLVTPKILREISEDLSTFKCGLAHLFLQHTSASLTINENYDSDVQDDTETFLNRIVPEGNSAPWKHTMEGPDDMPAHIKSSMFGCALTIPITDGRLKINLAGHMAV